MSPGRMTVSARAVVAGGSFPYTGVDDDFVTDVWRVIGGTPTQLTNYPIDDTGFYAKFNPAISPDGALVVYTVENYDTPAYELWSVSANGGTPTLLRSDTETLMHPFWHPDSSHFLYTEGLIGSWGGDIRRMDADGSNDTLILAGTAGAGPDPSVEFYRPQYNRDGTLIVFARKVEGTPDVFTLRVMEDDGSNEVEVATLVVYNQDGSQYAFANTTDRIAFYEGAGGPGPTNGDCYTIDPDGTDAVQISTPSGTLCRISKYSWLEDDSLVLGSAFPTTGPDTNHWYMVSYDPSGGPTMTVINNTVWAGVYSNRRQSWYWQGRLYFLEEGGTHPTLLVSILPDGSDYRVEHDIDATSGGVFADGQGLEYV